MSRSPPPKGHRDGQHHNGHRPQVPARQQGWPWQQVSKPQATNPESPVELAQRYCPSQSLAGHSPFCRRRVHQARSHPMRCQQSTGRCRTVAEKPAQYAAAHRGANGGNPQASLGRCVRPQHIVMDSKAERQREAKPARTNNAHAKNHTGRSKTGDW